MITSLKKILTVLFVIFLSSSLFFAEDAATDYDDIFANQKIEENDFYTIIVEPSKEEIQEQNNKFFEEVKQKNLKFYVKSKKKLKKKNQQKTK